MPLGSITQFAFGGGLTAANLNAPTNSLKALLDAYVDSGATFAAMTIPMLAATTGLKLTQNASVGLGVGPAFIQLFAGDGTTSRFSIDYAGNVVANGVTAQAFVGQLTSTTSNRTLVQTPGTKLNTYSVSPNPFGAEWAFGTDGAPMTVLGAGIKVSATYSQVASLLPGSNGLISEASTPIAGYVKALVTQEAQTTAGYFSAESASTHADTAGVIAIAIQRTGTHAAFGIYTQAERHDVNAFAFSGEIRVQNEVASDSYYHPDTGSPGYFQTAGFWITSGSTTGNKNGAGVALGNSGSPFIGGFVTTGGSGGNSVSQEAFADYSSATTSVKLAGSHTYGIDTKSGTFTAGAAMRLGNNQSIRARLADDSADATIIGFDTSNRVTFQNGLISMDTTGDLFTTGYVQSFDQGGSNQFGRWRVQPEVLAPAAVTAQAVPDFTVRIAAINAFSPTTGLPIVKAAQNTASMSGNVPGTGGQSVYILVSIDTNLASVLTVGTAAATPTRPGLPSNNKGLAYILLPNGATAVTQAMISEFRDLFVPYNPNASGGAPAGLTYVSIADETSSGLASSVRLVTALNGGSAMGDSLAQIKPLATDASLKDIVMADRQNTQLAQNLTYAGAVVTLNVPAGTQHTVRFNGRTRTITGNITATISGTVGAKTLYADLNTAGVSTFTLAFTAQGAGPSNSNQVPIGDIYWDGAAVASDGVTVVNGAQTFVVTGQQIRPRFLSAIMGSSYTATNTGAFVVVPAVNMGGVSFTTSGGQTYEFSGWIAAQINTVGLAATRAALTAGTGATIAGATPIGVTAYHDFTAAGLYTTLCIPIQIGLPANAKTFVTLMATSSVATGFQISNIWIYGMVTGAAA
jgi:hypothetical protein